MTMIVFVIADESLAFGVTPLFAFTSSRFTSSHGGGSWSKTPLFAFTSSPPNVLALIDADVLSREYAQARAMS
jgi:hypothetical protein